MLQWLAFCFSIIFFAAWGNSVLSSDAHGIWKWMLALLISIGFFTRWNFAIIKLVSVPVFIASGIFTVNGLWEVKRAQDAYINAFVGFNEIYAYNASPVVRREIQGAVSACALAAGMNADAMRFARDNASGSIPVPFMYRTLEQSLLSSQSNAISHEQQCQLAVCGARHHIIHSNRFDALLKNC